MESAVVRPETCWPISSRNPLDLQGGLFRKFRAKVLNVEDGCHEESDQDPKATTGVCCATSNGGVRHSKRGKGGGLWPNAEGGIVGIGNDELISNQAYVVNK